MTDRDIKTAVKAWSRPYLAVALGRLAQVTTTAAARVGAASFAPSAADILGNYTRGWLLFGLDASRLAPFEWRAYPTRAVITPDTAKVPKRLRPLQRRSELEIRHDQDFEAIVAQCRARRSGWLTEETVDAYRRVHALGFVSTTASYRDGRLVGGLWGIAVGRTLGIMSMFHLENHAGALALAALAEDVRDGGRWAVVDCGQLNENFRRYGAHEVSLQRFCELVWTNAPPAAGDNVP